MIGVDKFHKQPKEAFMRLRVEEILDKGAFVRLSLEDGHEFWAGTPPPDPPLRRLEQLRDRGTLDIIWVVFESLAVRVMTDEEDRNSPVFDRVDGEVLSVYHFRGRIAKALGRGQIPMDGRWAYKVVLSTPLFDIYSHLVSEEELQLESGSMIEADGHILAAVVEHSEDSGIFANQQKRQKKTGWTR